MLSIISDIEMFVATLEAVSTFMNSLPSSITENEEFKVAQSKLTSAISFANGLGFK